MIGLIKNIELGSGWVLKTIILILIVKSRKDMVHSSTTSIHRSIIISYFPKKDPKSHKRQSWGHDVLFGLSLKVLSRIATKHLPLWASNNFKIYERRRHDGEKTTMLTVNFFWTHLADSFFSGSSCRLGQILSRVNFPAKKWHSTRIHIWSPQTVSELGGARSFATAKHFTF